MANRKERHGLEAVLEGLETAADIVMNGDLLAEVPVVGLAFKLARAADSIRDRALSEKLARFASSLSSVSDQLREEFKTKLIENPEETKKIGETLFLVLERLTDFNKADLLGEVFVAYLGGIISSAVLRRLSHAIDVAFADDIKVLLEEKRDPKESQELWMQYLATSGLTRVRGGNNFDDVGQIFYEATALGLALRNSHYFYLRSTRVK